MLMVMGLKIFLIGIRDMQKFSLKNSKLIAHSIFFILITACSENTHTLKEQEENFVKFDITKQNNCAEAFCKSYISGISNSDLSSYKEISFGMRPQYIGLIAAQGIRFELVFSKSTANLHLLEFDTSLTGEINCQNFSMSIACLWLNNNTFDNIYYESEEIFKILIPKGQNLDFGSPVKINFVVDGGDYGEYSYSSHNFVY